MASKIPSVKLGVSNIPVVGLGTYKANTPDELVNAVKSAVSSGYRHFDCAHIYFNEEQVGQGIRESIAESNGALKREDFFITSKCWNTFHTPEKVKQSLKEVLDRLQMDYVDLYLMHWPMGLVEDQGDYPLDAQKKLISSDVHYTVTYKALEECVKAGTAKNIGVSNFNIAQLQEILDMATVKPVCNQFEVNPLWQNIELVDFCQKNDVTVVGYAPLGAPDRAWSKSGDPTPLENPVIKALAEKHKKSPAQIILKWLLSRNIVVIPKSVTPSRIAANIDLFDFELSQEDIDLFSGFTKEQFRFYAFEDCDQHPFYPFKA